MISPGSTQHETRIPPPPENQSQIHKERERMVFPSGISSNPGRLVQSKEKRSTEPSEAERPDEKLHRRSTVRMGIRVLQRAAQTPTPTGDEVQADAQVSSIVASGEDMVPPHATVDKPFLLSDGKVELEASLNKAVYYHGESVLVNVTVRNNSGKTIRRIKVFVVQHVDVCMFSNGKFKNVVALVNSKEECPLSPWCTLNRTYPLQPAKGATKNWIALEDSFSKREASLASTVTCPSNNPEDRNVFAIYVSYYVKVKILVGAMGGELSLKLPFTLIHSAVEPELPPPDVKLSPEKVVEKTEKTKDGIEVECHEPKSMKNITNLTNTVPKKPKPKRNTIENENEIIKFEEDAT